MKFYKKENKKKSIFSAIFGPLIIVMFFQSVCFYVAATYGGIVSNLDQNATDILYEQLTNRKNEIETKFNRDWVILEDCQDNLNNMYTTFTNTYGNNPFVNNSESQIKFLSDSTDKLIETLRHNQVNGIFLILNDNDKKSDLVYGEQKYGVCIRDIDQNSVYSDNTDLLIERAPSSIIEKINCSLDSWWEAKFLFEESNDNSYYYNPLNAAYDNVGAKSEDLAYFCGAHRLSPTSYDVVSYSIPLIDEQGNPYGVLGVELTTKYLASLLPSEELGDKNKSSYVLGLYDEKKQVCNPIISNGTLYNQCFDSNSDITITDKISSDGFKLTGRNNTKIYGNYSQLNIYNNNNPFEDNQLVLMALVDNSSLFSYSNNVRFTLLWISGLSLLLGTLAILFVSRHFANPITALAKKAQNVQPHSDFYLEHLGIYEIDQLVDSIEILSKNISKEVARIEFFSRMSHDMRTPMNAIISFSSPELLEGSDEALKLDYLNKIHTSGQFLLGLINEVLDMTKIENNKVDLHFKSVAIDHLWDAIIPMINELAISKDVHFIKKITHRPDVYVLVDLQHINQIVMNLLSNAVKFTPSGGKVNLEINFSSETINVITCIIKVNDTGIGMSKEFMKKLYTPFEQENNGLGGTGLGLSISKKLVDLMNGTIDCKSTKNVGTSFEVILPFTICNAPEVIDVKEEVNDINISHLKDKRLLVCEDHPLNMQIAKKLLERKGMMVECASNGKIGVEMFSSSKIGYYDAILMDIRMPEMDGLQAARTIRNVNREDAKSIPIIAMTANAFQEDINETLAAGMNAHLSKPIEPIRLYNTLASFLKE